MCQPIIPRTIDHVVSEVPETVFSLAKSHVQRRHVARILSPIVSLQHAVLGPHLRNMSRPQQEYVDPYEPGAQFVQQTRTHAQHPGHPQRGNFATSSTSSLAPPSMSRNASDPSMSSGALALQQLDGTLQSQRRMSGPPASPPGHVITHQGVTGQSYTDVSDIHSSTSHALQANADAFFGHAAMGVSVRSNVGPALGPSIGPTGTRLPAAVHPPPGQPIGLSAYSSTGPHGGSSAGQFGVASVGPPGVSRLGMSSGVVRPGQRQYSSGAYHAGSDARQSSMQQFAGRLGNEGIGSRLPVGVGGLSTGLLTSAHTVPPPGPPTGSTTGHSIGYQTSHRANPSTGLQTCSVTGTQMGFTGGVQMQAGRLTGYHTGLPTGAPTGLPTGAPTGPPVGVQTGPSSGHQEGMLLGPPTSFTTGFHSGTSPGLPAGRPTGYPSGPPAGPPTGFSTGPPTGPLTGPSTGPPTGPPTGRSTGPSTGFSTGPPTGLSTGSPSGPSTGPPTGLSTGPPTGSSTGPPTDLGSSSGLPTGPPTGRSSSFPTGLPTFPSTGTSSGPPTGLSTGPPTGSLTGPPTGSLTGLSTGPPTGLSIGSSSGLPTGPSTGRSSSFPTGLPTFPSTGTSSGPPTGLSTGPPTGSLTGLSTGPPTGLSIGSLSGLPTGPPTGCSSSFPTGPPTGFSSGPPTGAPAGPPTGLSSGPPTGPSVTVSSGQTSAHQSVFSDGKHTRRYPSMPTAAADALESQSPQLSQPSQSQFAAPVAAGAERQAGGVAQHPGMSQGMSGIDRRQEQQAVLGTFNLLERRHIVPAHPAPVNNPVVDNKNNCPVDLLSCTLNAVPETQSLLDKARLPFGIHLHPFKELQEDELSIIQSGVIIRCRGCRTYISPFVQLVDQRRWRCNVCFRINDGGDELEYDTTRGRFMKERKPEMRNCVVEYVAPSEYMLRPPQPSVFLFVLDVSTTALETGYLPVFCNCLLAQLDKLPGDSRMMIGLMSFNSSLHFYSMKAGLSQPQMMVVSDVEDQFFPSPDGLLVNLKESRQLVESLLEQLPSMFNAATVPYDPNSAVGPALLAAFKLVSSHGGRITFCQASLPNFGEGQLKAREDSSQLQSKAQDVLHLQPATDFYKKLALDCSQQQVAIDLFLLSSKYADLSSISPMCKFSSGCVNYYRNFNVDTNPAVARKFQHDLRRYLTRPIGYEAVMRIRCTRGLALHAFHGNCFIRSTDLLSLPNVNPDHGFAIQVAIEESLTDIPCVCFQAALLYTSSRGERRIRVHTLVLPTTRNIQQIYANANQHAIVGMVSKMAVDRCFSSSVGAARDGIINVVIDVLAAYRMIHPSHQHGGLLVSTSLSLLALHLQALLKHTAFRLSGAIPVDERVFAMLLLKSLPLSQHMTYVYPQMYAIHLITEDCIVPMKDGPFYNVPVLQLTAEKLSRKGAYLIDNGQELVVWIGRDISNDFCIDVFGKTNYSNLPEFSSNFPCLENPRSQCVYGFIKQLQDSQPHHASLYILREDSRVQRLFTRHLLDDRTDSSMSYYEFLLHVQRQLTK